MVPTVSYQLLVLLTPITIMVVFVTSQIISSHLLVWSLVWSQSSVIPYWCGHYYGPNHQPLPISEVIVTAPVISDPLLVRSLLWRQLL